MGDQPAVRALGDADRPWVRDLLVDTMAGPTLLRRGELVDAGVLDGFVAELGGERVGAALVDVRDDECELVFLASAVEGAGVARALLDAVVDHARSAGCRRAWLVTTNHNVRALALYQRNGWDLRRLHRGAVTAARHLKPQLPESIDGIPLRHELELELVLDDDRTVTRHGRLR
ncbi:MAG: GNAT family N-acetyltransferase [Actinomycetota bacterium]|nr:GNAT family N-acetyltransferase [Actinomycetota bacterium]